jgi:hypothetical protein
MNLLNWILIFLNALISMVTAAHALLYKRDPRAASGWILVCILLPLVGPFLYFLFGINRVRSLNSNLAWCYSVQPQRATFFSLQVNLHPKFEDTIRRKVQETIEKTGVEGIPAVSCR